MNRFGGCDNSGIRCASNRPLLVIAPLVLLAGCSGPNGRPGDTGAYATSGSGASAEGGSGGSSGSHASAGTSGSAGTGHHADGSTGTAESGGGCELVCPEGESCTPGDGADVCACAPDSCPSPTQCMPDGHCGGLVWPNDDSQANSDPWLAAHHDEITLMRPRILALNYVNARSMDDMQSQLQEVADILAEGSRYHGYADPDAPAFLDYQLATMVDLRDASPPPGWQYNNSSLYPRENPPTGTWGFDYGQLFTQTYADLLGIQDPSAPGTNLLLCDAIHRGLVHEIWVYADADVPDVSAAEILELKPKYDEQGNRLPGAMEPCSGNGCFDQDDVIPCQETVRIAWFNNTRGPGCFMESLSHGFEGMGRKDWLTVPYLSRYFPEFAGMRLDDEYGLSFPDWYYCPYGVDCLSYPSPTSVTYDVSPELSGTITPYDPGCGNVHFPPNARSQYDLAGPDTVQTSCMHWRDGSGATDPYTSSLHQPYDQLAPDCMGPHTVWWRQNMPGLNNAAIDDDGAPMHNWWPYLYY